MKESINIYRNIIKKKGVPFKFNEKIKVPSFDSPCIQEISFLFEPAKIEAEAKPCNGAKKVYFFAHRN